MQRLANVYRQTSIPHVIVVAQRQTATPYVGVLRYGVLILSVVYLPTLGADRTIIHGGITGTSDIYFVFWYRGSLTLFFYNPAKHYSLYKGREIYFTYLSTFNYSDISIIVNK